MESDRPGGPDLAKSHELLKFLNRILGMRVQFQNKLFQYYVNTYQDVVREEKRRKTFDYGIQDLGAHGEELSMRSLATYSIQQSTSMARIELNLYEVTVNRGMTWEMALEKAGKLTGANGFYSSYAHNTIYLLQQAGNGRYEQFRPNRGHLNQLTILKEFKENHYRVKKAQAEYIWREQYRALMENCSHIVMYNTCKVVDAGSKCWEGRGEVIYHILTGDVLGVWNQVEAVLKSGEIHWNQVLRIHSERKRFVGIMIPRGKVAAIKVRLNSAVTRGDLDEQEYDDDSVDEDVDGYLDLL